jgi:hypothetical protein
MGLDGFGNSGRQAGKFTRQGRKPRKGQLGVAPL